MIVTRALLALLLGCAGSAAVAQNETAGAQDFDLGARPIDAEALLTTNAGATEGRERPCVPSDGPGEIVVCAPDDSQFRVESPVQEANRTGERPDDEVPRAPDLAGPCTGVCTRVGATPYRPILIDLSAIPQPLPGEVAEKVHYALTPEQRAAAEAPATLHDPYAAEETPAPEASAD
jgi:hypothetical protein